MKGEVARLLRAAARLEAEAAELRELAAVAERPPASALLTIQEVAEDLRLSKTQVYTLIYGGQLAAVRTGVDPKKPKGGYGIERQELENFKRRRRTASHETEGSAALVS